VPSDRRKGDIKVLVGATLAVLLLGGFIAGAAIVTTRGGSGIECGQLDIGLATDVRNNLNAGPYFVTGGARCSFWLAIDNGDIVAYKAVQPSGCTLLLRPDHWSCGGRTVAVTGIAQYPLSIQTVHSVDAVIVNLGSPTPSSTTSAGT
jgi:hypothetical protein